MEPDATPSSSIPAAQAQTCPTEPADRSVQSPPEADSPLSTCIRFVAARPSRGVPGRLQEFLTTDRTEDALRIWLGGPWEGSVDQLLRRLNFDVAQIDQHVDRQINAILHAPEFQRLEAAWRGLEYLVECTASEGDQMVEIKFLSASKEELADDFDEALDFDQSHLFRTVYDQEFGMPGGEPFGVLIGDFQIGPRDMEFLTSVSKVAAAAFCPFISNAAPAMFDLENFDALERELDHERTFSQSSYRDWQKFRLIEEARFVGLVLPQVLMRLPFEGDQADKQGFLFTEEIRSPKDYLWGGAAFAFGEVLIRAFAESRWLADIRGVRRGYSGGGLVENLPVPSVSTDYQGLVVSPSTDLIVTDALEKELSELGFIPLCDCYDTEFAAFYSAQSVQQPRKYNQPDATVNAKISANLQYIFCVSRFAHYLKTIGRDTIGDTTTAREFESKLNTWLADYVTPDTEATPEVKARRPLYKGSVQVIPEPGKPGSFQAVLRLMPHYQLEDIKANVTLVTQMTASHG